MSDYDCEKMKARSSLLSSPPLFSVHSPLTVNDLADALSSFPDMILALFLVSLSLSMAGGFTNTM